MSVIGLGIIGGFAATTAVQRTADKERVANDTIDQSLRSRTQASAENASGIGEPEQEQAIGERDADGRRAWELPAATDEAADSSSTTESLPVQVVRDIDGECGSQLDVVG